MNFPICPACKSERISIRRLASTVSHRGIDVEVPEIEDTTCHSCGFAFDTPLQHDANIANIKAAFLRQRAAAKAIQGLLSGAEIKSIREKLRLTQREAAMLFGGGPVAFAKYEAEDVVHSLSMDRLLRLASMMGEAALVLLRTVSQPAGDKPVISELQYEQAAVEKHFVPMAIATPTNAQAISLAAWQPADAYPQ